MGELVLITGASSGIGLSAAIECAAAGHRVIATLSDTGNARALLAAAEARSVSVDVEQLDVTSEGVPRKLKELVLKYGPIFAVVNAAGEAVTGPFEEQSENDLRRQFETNVFGLMGVTRGVLPCMRASRRGRIINISGLSGRVAFPMVSTYAASKHAVEGFSEALRWELEGFGVEVCLVEPGFTVGPRFERASARVSSPPSSRALPAERDGAPFSERGDSGFPESTPRPSSRRGGKAMMDSAYAVVKEAFDRYLSEEAETAPSEDIVGRAIAKLVSEPHPPFRTTIGMDARTLVALRKMIPDRIFASGIRRFMNLRRSR